MLNQLLQALGIRDYTALTAEEKKVYEDWGRILTAQDVSLEDVKKLMGTESRRAHEELKKFDNSKDRQIFYQALAHLTDTLTLFIDTPAVQREALRAQLKQQFKVEI